MLRIIQAGIIKQQKGKYPSLLFENNLEKGKLKNGVYEIGNMFKL
jgi:hypothetical protein